MNTLNELVAKINLLNTEDQEVIIKRFESLLKEINAIVDPGANIIQARRIELSKSKMTCMFCSSDRIIGYGATARGSKRFRCKECLKTFNETTGTAVSLIRDLSKFNHYLQCMLNGFSLRKCANEVGITLQTSFRWRHCILNYLEKLGVSELKNIVEVDETFLLHSEKGGKKIEGREPRKRGGKATSDGLTKEHVSIMISKDREGNQNLIVAGRGKLTKAAIHRAIGTYITKGNVIVTDMDRNLRFYLNDRHIEHVQLSARKKERVKDKIYHLQNVNNTHMRLKKWLEKFNGVSSYYLQNYLNLFHAFELIKQDTNQLQTLTSLVLRNQQQHTRT